MRVAFAVPFQAIPYNSISYSVMSAGRLLKRVGPGTASPTGTTGSSCPNVPTCPDCYAPRRQSTCRYSAPRPFWLLSGFHAPTKKRRMNCGNLNTLSYVAICRGRWERTRGPLVQATQSCHTCNPGVSVHPRQCAVPPHAAACGSCATSSMRGYTQPTAQPDSDRPDHPPCRTAPTVLQQHSRPTLSPAKALATHARTCTTLSLSAHRHAYWYPLVSPAAHPLLPSPAAVHHPTNLLSLLAHSHSHTCNRTKSISWTCRCTAIQHGMPAKALGASPQTCTTLLASAH